MSWHHRISNHSSNPNSNTPVWRQLPQECQRGIPLFGTGPACVAGVGAELQAAGIGGERIRHCAHVTLQHAQVVVRLRIVGRRQQRTCPRASCTSGAEQWSDASSMSITPMLGGA